MLDNANRSRLTSLGIVFSPVAKETRSFRNIIRNFAINYGPLSLVLIISLLLHSFNMFHFPYYENDEGVYISQAWSLITQGKLAPYTYWYDHAPAGWFFIAIWQIITGGFFTFGTSVNSGRVFMLLLHVFSTYLLFDITNKLTNNKLIAFFSALIFSITPLGIYFHRRVLLDNIMTFWVLVTLSLVLKEKYKLSQILLSAVIFGIAILSKENAIFFIPTILYIIYSKVHKKHKEMAIINWLAVMAVVVSVYFLYALLKHELFPVGFLGSNSQHVSLITTLKDQYSRSGGGILDMPKSSFWRSMDIWMSEDGFIIVSGALATLFNLLFAYKNYAARVSAFLSLSFWFFLMRGGLVIEFYVIPLLPLLALNIGVAVWLLQQGIQHTSKNTYIRAVSYFPVIFLLFITTFVCLYEATTIRTNKNLFKSDQTTPQIKAIEYIKRKSNPQDLYVIDNYGYVDLHDKSVGKYVDAQWYWKIDRDPEIRKEVLDDSPQTIDYIALTPQMEHDITTAGLDITKEAWHNSKPIARFWKDDWGVEIWATSYIGRILKSSWQSYKTRYIESGRVIDPYTNNSTTSEGQSYALLRAVWMDDKEAFDQIYKWTQQKLKLENDLFGWKYQITPSEEIFDQGTATDADSDIALALAFAYKRWGDNNNYLEEALSILDAIWNYETVGVGEKRFLVAGNWANNTDTITINPSYLSPASYKIFEDLDKQHDWSKIVDSSYEALSMCTDSKLDSDSKGKLPPEWCNLDKNTLQPVMPNENLPSSSDYSYNAIRIPWRIALDYEWNKDPRARLFLTSLSFLKDEITSNGRISTAYKHDGSVLENYESVSGYSGNLGYFLVTDSQIAQKIYNEKILAKFYEDDTNGSYWDDPQNYYTQNLGWFATALYGRKLVNLWDAEN